MIAGKHLDASTVPSNWFYSNVDCNTVSISEVETRLHRSSDAHVCRMSWTAPDASPGVWIKNRAGGQVPLGDSRHKVRFTISERDLAIYNR